MSACLEQTLCSRLESVSNPLDMLDYLGASPTVASPQRSQGVAARLGIPKEDMEFFNSLLNDPKLMDITQDIAYLRYLRAKLQQSIEARRDAMVIELGHRMMESLDSYLWSPTCIIPEHYRSDIREWMKGTLERLLNEHFPILDLDRTNAASLRDMVTALGKMASDWKKVTEGITVKIESNEDAMFLAILQKIMIPVIPRQYWPLILERAEGMTRELTPALPEGMVEYLA